MTTYQDVITANKASLAYALTEAAGNFAPYIGAGALVATAVIDYQQVGPAGTDFGINFHAAAKATYTFAATLSPPTTFELWVKMSTVTPANHVLWSTGTPGTNGLDMYMTNTGHLHVSGGGSWDIDTGYVWPDLNWHLLQFISTRGSQDVDTVAIDGVIRWQTPVPVGLAPTPNVLTIGGGPAAGAVVPFLVAWPALYLYPLNPGELAATDTAITDPAGALGQTLTGGGSVSGSDRDLLLQILAAVHKTW